MTLFPRTRRIAGIDTDAAGYLVATNWLARCGCLSIENCALINPNDELARELVSSSKLEGGVAPVEGHG